MRTRLPVRGCLLLSVVCLSSIASAQTNWARIYGGAEDDYGSSVQQTSDGGFVIAGQTESFGAGGSDVYLIKTNAQGDTLWTRTYGGSSGEGGNSVQQTTDGGYIVAGSTNSFGTGYNDVYLIKTSSSGDTLWTRTYGGSMPNGGNSVQATTDGGYIVAGSTTSTGAGGRDVYLIKTNPAGDTLWTRTYGGTNFDGGYSVQQTADGGCMIAGYTGSFGAGDTNVYLIRTNSQGNSLWSRTYGGTRRDEGFSVQPTSDGGYIIAGCTESFGARNLDVYLIKTDSLGYVGVEEVNPKPQVMRGRLGTTVLSGASGVRQLASCVAFDAMGRRVLHPKPGIYFLRTTSTVAPRKVLLVD